MAKTARVKIDLEFYLTDKVQIIELERSGRIVEVRLTDIGTKYFVRYFDNGAAQTVAFFPDELELKNEGDGRP